MEAASTDLTRRVNEWIHESGFYDRIVGREPRWRYWEHNGWIFGWTTERMGDGKFGAFIYRPLGKGSSELVVERHYAKRMTAKAKARSWWEATREQASGRPPARILKLGRV